MKSFFLIFLLPCLSYAGPYYEVKNSTTLGTSTMTISGYIGVAASSTTPTTYKFRIDGPNGYIQFPDGTQQTTATSGNAVLAATQTFTGQNTFYQGVKVSTYSGQMFLVHYSTALVSLAVGGVTGSPAALSSDLVRVGNLVTITVPAMANYTKDGNAGPITLSSIPAGFRPNIDVAWVLPCVINNAYNTARLGLISSTGVFNFYYANDTGNTPPNNFAGGLANNYCDTGFSVSWTVR